MIKESALFSEVMEKSTHNMKEKVLKTSMSVEDFNGRMDAYQKVFSNMERVKEISKMYSGFSEVPLLANQYFNASVMSYVNSFAPYISVERFIDQPVAIQSWFNILGTSDGRTVMPNLGTENLAGIRANITFPVTLATGTNGYTATLAKTVIPGSFSMKVTHTSGATTTITDDRNGNLMGTPGVLTAGTITYSSGAVAFTFGAGWVPATSDVCVISAWEDVPGNTTGGANQNRFKAELKYTTITSQPDFLMAENDIITMAASNKSIGSDLQGFMATKLAEMFTKLINTSLVSKVVGAWAGTTATVDLRQSGTNYLDYQSAVHRFVGFLLEIDSLLAQGSYKGVKATAYIAGPDVVTMFRKTKITGNWTENTEMNYINDLAGTFDGVPVLRTNAIGSKECYAIHKTAGGEMAPVMRGIYLPLSPTAVVGNYLNPTQVAQGLYYMEGHEAIAPSLIQKFTIEQDK